MKGRGYTYEKPLTEAETREKLFAEARRLGCYMELRQILERYDRMLKNCKDQSERKQISVMGNVEIHKLFNFRDALVVDQQIILPADPTYKPIE